MVEKDLFFSFVGQRKILERNFLGQKVKVLIFKDVTDPIFSQMNRVCSIQDSIWCGDSYIHLLLTSRYDGQEVLLVGWDNWIDTAAGQPLFWGRSWASVTRSSMDQPVHFTFCQPVIPAVHVSDHPSTRYLKGHMTSLHPFAVARKSSYCHMTVVIVM